MRPTLLMLTLILSCMITCTAFGVDTRLQKNGFSIAIPDGWSEFPRDVLDDYGKIAAQLVADTDFIKYECGFQMNSQKKWFDYPYILVQFEQIGRVAKSRMEFFERYTGVDNLETGIMVYDEKSNMMWTRIESSTVKQGPTRGIIGMVPTASGFIQFMGVSLKDDFSTYVPVFQAIARSITPDPDLAYTLPDVKKKSTPSPETPEDTKKNIFNVVAAAILLSIIGGAGALIVFRKKKTKEA